MGLADVRRDEFCVHMRAALVRASGWGTASGVLLLYAGLTAVFTWPLLHRLGSSLGADAGDPALTALVLWRNAFTVPLTREWWNAPQFYPVEGVTALTESFLGVSLFAAPVAWISGNPVLTFNVALFITWPLSAWSVFLLVRHLTGRTDAALLAGISFGFTPYRADSLAHLHTLSIYWLPFALLALHGYLHDRRARWLWLFGVAWLMQSLTSGHHMMFGAVLIALWLVYFCSTRQHWRAAAAVAGAGVVASLPLLPLLGTFWLVHQELGLKRSVNEIMAFSATPGSWAAVSPEVWLWGRLLGHGSANLFPGVTAGALVCAAAIAAVRHRRDGIRVPLPTRRLRMWLTAAFVVSAAAIGVSLYAGRWSVAVAGITLFRMGSVDRALAVLLASGAAWFWLTPRARDAFVRRSPFLFYAAMVVVAAILCFGPVLRGGGEVILSQAPYGWLMALPGFDGLRVVTRAWMIGVLCLAVAAGLAYAHLQPRGGRAVVLALVAAGLLVDGWMRRMPMEAPPETWALVEPRGRAEPILELPFFTNDYAATYRAVLHGRRIFNGVSGYHPPHYVALRDGLARRDPATLRALASFGPFDAVIDRSADPDGSLVEYVAASPGARQIADDGVRVAYRIPGGAAEPPLGPPVPLARAWASRHPEQVAFVHDGILDTGWGDYPQVPGQWLVIDLGTAREVAGVTHAIGEYLLDFPRRLAIDLSTDGAAWERVWEGPTAAPTVLAYLREPREGALRLAFSPRAAQFVRLEQLDAARSMWRVSELQVHAPE